MPLLPARKLRERYLLERFLEVAKIDALITAESEAPDFQIIVDGRSVGVEVTEVFVPSDANKLSRQAAESLTSRIIATARQLYEKRGNRPVHVTVAFFAGIDLRDVRRDKVAEALANLVQDMPLRDQGHTSWRNNYDDEALQSIAFVNVLPVPELRMAHWGVARAGWVAPLALDTLQASISAKNQRVEAYKKKHAEVWLVLAIEGSKPSQFFDRDHLPDGSMIHSNFDKTLFFCSFPPRVLQLGNARQTGETGRSE